MFFPQEEKTKHKRNNKNKTNFQTYSSSKLIIQTYSLFKSHLAVQIWTIIYVEYLENSWEIYLAEHFVRKNCDSTGCDFLNTKLRQEYFSTNITKFSEQVSLKHLQEYNILLMSKSEHMLS